MNPFDEKIFVSVNIRLKHVSNLTGNNGED